MGSTFTGLTGKSKEDFGHGDAKFVTYMNVYLNSVANPTMTEIVEIDEKQNIVQKGDVFFTTSSETPEEVGMSSVWLENTDNTYLNSFCFGYRPSIKVNNYYLAYMLRSNPVREKIVLLAQGISRYNISKNKVMEIEVSIPEINEQHQIGLLFCNIDNLITLHQRKLDKTKELKKTLLSKMFPKNDEDAPEIRFKGFTDAWEQRKLGEMANIVRGASPRPIKDPRWFNSESVVGWLRISDVTEQDGRIHFLEQRLSEIGQEKTRVLREPHLLLSIAATVGKPVINYVQTGVHDGFLIFLSPKFDREFMFQWLEMFRSKWQEFGQPGSQVNLNSDLVKNKDIMLPSDSEQIKLGVFLKNLDNLITLHQREVDQLKNMKKTLLKYMFV